MLITPHPAAMQPPSPRGEGINLSKTGCGASFCYRGNAEGVFEVILTPERTINTCEGR